MLSACTGRRPKQRKKENARKRKCPPRPACRGPSAWSRRAVCKPQPAFLRKFLTARYTTSPAMGSAVTSAAGLGGIGGSGRGESITVTLSLRSQRSGQRKIDVSLPKIFLTLCRASLITLSSHHGMFQFIFRSGGVCRGVGLGWDTA
jgi:hypothetical protein